MNEIWNPVPGYENHYEVSNTGKVKSLKYKKHRIMSYSMVGRPGNEYPSVTLTLNNIHKRFYIHKLVAMTFLPNPECKPQVNHKDRNKTNNHVENLEWVTAKENMKHLYTNIKGQWLGVFNKHKLCRPIIQLNMDGSFLNKYPSISEAARQILNSDRKSISSCVNGRRKQTCGYKFMFAD